MNGMELSVGKIDKELAIQMRREGRTYEEIGKHFGVSKQGVHDLLNRNPKARKDCKTIDLIPYKGLYEFMVANETMTIARLTKIMFGYQKSSATANVRSFLCGRNTSFPKSVYDNLIAHTGMTYEQLFEPREGFDG
jgi:hypothetical protein